MKDKLVLLLDKTFYVPHKTRSKFIDSQNFYFHFHYNVFCINAVHLSDKLSLMCPRSWSIDDICIGLYVLKRRLNVRHILEKIISMQHSFEEFSEKQRRVKLKSVGNFVATAVVVEGANQFSLEEMCRTKFSLKYFSKPHRPSDSLEDLKLNACRTKCMNLHFDPKFYPLYLYTSF